ncbi:MAG: hypothetical protein QOI10_3811 [Solirubrobacterales bacterium]|jgi:hypothetical protein|nr:hypothetical protein [Solirubrobacterales bacterium]
MTAPGLEAEVISKLLIAAGRGVESLLPHAFYRARRYLGVDSHVRAFFKPFLKEAVIVVPPFQDVDPVIRGTQVQDYMGVIQLIGTLAGLGSHIIAEPAEAVSETSKRKNIIAVGGPIPNPITREVLRQPGLIYGFPTGPSDDDANGDPATQHVIVDRGGRRFDCEFGAPEKVVKDYAIITRCSNPYQSDKDIIVVCGIFGWGTRAGLQLLCNARTLKFIQGKANDKSCHFQVICACEIDDNQIALEPYLLDTARQPLPTFQPLPSGR